MLALPQEPHPIFLKEQPMVILPCLKRLVGPLVIGLRAHFLQWTAPLTTSLPLQTLADLGRSRSELVAENALLRVPLIILKRQGALPKKSHFSPFLWARGVSAQKVFYI